MARKIPQGAIYFLGIVLISILGIYITTVTTRLMDIQLSDETQYLLGGINFLHHIPSSWGPGYSAWYKVLHFIESDPIALYYFNYRTLSVILSLLIFSVLFRLNVPILISFFTAIAFLFCDLIIFSWPIISHFAACIILTTFLISTFLNSTYKKLLLFTMAALIMYYARPETALSFLIMLLVTGGYVIWKKFRIRRSEYAITIAVLPVVALLFLMVDVPLVSSGKLKIDEGKHPRSILAYGQHFYLTHCEMNNVEDMVMPKWFEVFDEYYEVDPSLVKTLMTNIPATFRHVMHNVGNYFTTAFDYISGVFLPDKILYFPIWLKFLLFLGALAFLAFRFSLKNYLDKLKAHLTENGLSILLVFVLTIPSMISCLLIYPREHYIMLQIPFYFILISMLLLVHFRKAQDARITTAGLAVLTLLFMLLLPKADKYEHFSTWQKRSGLVNLGAINKINEMNIQEPFNIILAEGRMDTYLENKTIRTMVGYHRMGGLPLETAIDTLNIGMVYMTSILDVDPAYKEDEDWVNFINDPSSLNFERVDLLTPYSYLLVNRKLLQE